MCCATKDPIWLSYAGMVLYPNIDFPPKANSQFHVTQPIEVLTMHGDIQPGLHLLCVRRAPKFYLMRTASFGDGDDIQLFLAYGG